MTDPAELELRLRVAANTRHWREKRGLTQSDLAEELDCQPLWVARLETGARSPSLRMLAAVAAALDIDARQLLAKRAFKKRKPGRPQGS